MSQPVKLSDALVLDARLAGSTFKRSIAGQIEYWAALGQALEPILKSSQAKAVMERLPGKPVAECLKIVGTEQGRAKLRAYLETTPYPHYEPVPGQPGFLLRIDQDGTRTIGRFVNRVFKPAKNARRS